MNVATNYSGRLVDVEGLQTVAAPTGMVQVYFTATTGQRIVSGIQKLIQRYAIIYLSNKDSYYDPVLGTDFMMKVVNGLIQTRENVAVAFAFANDDVLRILRVDDVDPKYGTLPDDEKVDKVTLEDYNVDLATGTLFLRLKIATKAGDSAEFLLPATAPRS